MSTARPFLPFVVHFTNGHQLPVRHPEFFMISPGGSTALAYVGDEAAEVIRMAQVTHVAYATEPTHQD